MDVLKNIMFLYLFASDAGEAIATSISNLQSQKALPFSDEVLRALKSPAAFLAVMEKIDLTVRERNKLFALMGNAQHSVQERIEVFFKQGVIDESKKILMIMRAEMLARVLSGFGASPSRSNLVMAYGVAQACPIEDVRENIIAELGLLESFLEFKKRFRSF